VPPHDGYEEIGLLTSSEGTAFAENPEEFKRAVQADVCRVGGDIVVTEVNGWGGYVRGTILRKKI
jgi:hypothetical protein